MYYYLNKYLNQNCVLINRLSTYPKKWVDFLETHKKDSYKNDNETNEQIIREFADLILKSNVEFLCFHATRLTKEEMSSIKKDGLRYFDKNTIYEIKLKPLYENGYINLDELKLLNEKNLLNRNSGRENIIYVHSGYYSIKFEKGKDNFNLLNNWGGEIIYNVFENTPLGDKIRAVSKPCVVVLKVKCAYEGCYDIANRIIYFFDINKIQRCSYNIIFEKTILPIMDILEVDEKSKLVLKRNLGKMPRMK